MAMTKQKYKNVKLKKVINTKLWIMWITFTLHNV